MLFSKSCVEHSLTDFVNYFVACSWPMCVASLCHNWFYDYSISLLKLSDILGGNCLKVNFCVLMN